MTDQNMAANMPHGVLGLRPEPFPWLFWLILGAVVLLLGYAFFEWRKRRKPKDVKTAAKEVPELSLEARLDRIKSRVATLTPGEPFRIDAQEQFYYDLSYLLRELIELRCGIAATDMTSAELKQPLIKKLPVRRQEIDGILQFFHDADLVKFAAREMTLAEALNVKVQVERWTKLIAPGPEVWRMDESSSV